MKFWILIIAAFLALLFTVNYVSRRASQVEVDEAARPAPMAPAAASPAVQVHQAPRSYSPAATSAALYKCVDGSGHQSFQSLPCPGDSTQAWVRDATPEAEPSRAELRRRAQAQQRAVRRDARPSESQNYSPGSASMPRGPGTSAACQAARAADAAYRRQPLRYVTHDGLRRHGDQVNAACY